MNVHCVQRTLFSRKKTSLKYYFLNKHNHVVTILRFQEEANGMGTYTVTNGSEILGTKSEYYKNTNTAIDACSNKHVFQKLPQLSKERYKQELEQFRARIDSNNPPTPIALLTYYTDLLDSLLDTMQAMCKDDMKGDAASRCVSGILLLRTCNQLAIERGIGSIYYILGILEVDIHFEFVSNVELAEDLDETVQHLELSYSEGEEQYSVSDEELIENSIRLTEHIAQNNPQQPDLYDSLVWYRTIDYIYSEKLQMRQTIMDSIDDNISNRRDTYILSVASNSAIIIVMLFVITPFFSFNAHQSNENLSLYATVMVNQTKLMKKEKQRTEKLLNEMLPMSISYRYRLLDGNA